MTKKYRPPIGLDRLFEVVDAAASFPGFTRKADELIAARVQEGLGLAEAARAVRVPASKLLVVMMGSAAWRTERAYDYAIDRLRTAGKLRREWIGRRRDRVI